MGLVGWVDGAEFNESQQMFAQLRKDDPYRLENVDAYSNILYVMVSAGQSWTGLLPTCCLIPVSLLPV